MKYVVHTALEGWVRERVLNLRKKGTVKTKKITLVTIYPLYNTCSRSQILIFCRIVVVYDLQTIEQPSQLAPGQMHRGTTLFQTTKRPSIQQILKVIFFIFGTSLRITYVKQECILCVLCCAYKRPLSLFFVCLLPENTNSMNT